LKARGETLILPFKVQYLDGKKIETFPGNEAREKGSRIKSEWVGIPLVAKMKGTH